MKCDKCDSELRPIEVIRKFYRSYEFSKPFNITEKNRDCIMLDFKKGELFGSDVVHQFYKMGLIVEGTEYQYYDKKLRVWVGTIEDLERK